MGVVRFCGAEFGANVSNGLNEICPFTIHYVICNICPSMIHRYLGLVNHTFSQLEEVKNGQYGSRNLSIGGASSAEQMLAALQVLSYLNRIRLIINILIGDNLVESAARPVD